MATFTASILINTSAKKVFDALTKPELIRRWQFDKTLTTDWRPGSRIQFNAVFEGRVLEQWGTVIEIRPNELVKYNLFTPRPGLEDKTENYCTTTYILTAKNNATRLELIQEDNRPGSYAPISLMPILAVLKKVVEVNS